MFAKAATAGVVVAALDQALKAFVASRLEVCHCSVGFSHCPYIDILGPVAFIHRQNAGGPFAVAEGLIAWLILGAVALVAVPIFVVMLRRRHFESGTGGILFLGAALLAGGVVSNLLDRIREGFVVDYIWVLGGSSVCQNKFLTFNLGDVALLAGMALLSYAVITSASRQ
jgi:signal peptidase II